MLHLEGVWTQAICTNHDIEIRLPNLYYFDGTINSDIINTYLLQV